MNEVSALAAVSTAEFPTPLALRLGDPPAVATAPSAPSHAGFGDLLMAGLRSVDSKVTAADSLVAQYALDDAVPVHQVMIALEEARISVELAMQIRARLVEGYRELMNMQL